MLLQKSLQKERNRKGLFEGLSAADTELCRNEKSISFFIVSQFVDLQNKQKRV